MSNTSKDAYGNEFSVGEKVVFATANRGGTSAVLRAGIVRNISATGRVTVQQFAVTDTPGFGSVNASISYAENATGKKVVLSSGNKTLRW